MQGNCYYYLAHVVRIRIRHD